MVFKIHYGCIVTQEPPWAPQENLKTQQNSPKFSVHLEECTSRFRKLNRTNRMERSREKCFPEDEKQDSQVTEFIIYKMLI